MTKHGVVAGAVGLLVAATLPAPPATATFPGTNGVIAFSTSRVSGNREIFRMAADGSGPVNLTNSPGLDDEPAWSADGTKIAFTSARDGDNEIFVMNADGTGQVQLTFNTGFDSQPTWRPDGGKIAFASDRDGDLEIFVMNPDGSSQVQLTFNTGDDAQPAWSPAGGKIAFVTGRDSNFEIYTMNPDGSAPVNLTGNPAADMTPDWAPDASKIVFSRGTFPTITDFEIVMMNADGTMQVPLTSNSLLDTQPIFAPDRSRLAFMRDLGDNEEVFTMGLDGSAQTNLTMNAADDFVPDWRAVSPAGSPAPGTPAPGNRPPMFSAASPCAAAVVFPAFNFGPPVSAALAATDPDAGQTVTLSASGLPMWAMFTTSAGNPAAATITGTPSIIDWLFGLFMPAAVATVGAVDGAGGSASCAVTLRTGLITFPS